MTLGEIETRVYEALGDLDDIDPRTFGSASEVKLRGWVNTAYKQILMWKYPSGEHIRFPCLEQVLFLSTVVRTGTCASGTDNTAVLDIGSGVSTDDDRYLDWILEITGGTGSGQRRIIVDYVGTTKTATVHKDWDTNPDATSTYSLYKRMYTFRESTHAWVSDDISLSPISSFLSVQKITDLAMPWDLSQGAREENYTMFMTTPSKPMSYFTRGSTIYFNVPIDEVKTYRIEIAAFPDELSLAADEPQIPEHFHEAVIFYAMWIGLTRNQESAKAYSIYRTLETFMNERKQVSELAFERADAHVEVL